MIIEVAAWDDPDVQRLTTDQQTEIRARYGGKEEPGRAPGLEDAPSARGWTVLRLETGPLQPEAAGLYAGAGYRRTGPFGAYGGDPDAADSLFFEKDVDPA